MIITKITHECDDCETEMVIEQLDLSNEEPTVWLQGLSQSTFECPECGLKHYVGDIDIYNEREL